MKNFLKTIICFMCCALIFTGHTSADSTALTTVPRVDENISGSVENSSLTRIESRSREAAVKIETPGFEKVIRWGKRKHNEKEEE